MSASVAIDPRTMIRMRIARRFSHYNVGDVIALDLDSARDAFAKRLAVPLDMLVPTPRPGAGDGPGAPPPAAPSRATGTVRK